MKYEEQYNVRLYKYHVADTNWFLFLESQLPLIGFSSLYAVTEESAKAIETGGSPAGFKGAVWSAYLVIDFDDETSAMEARERLTRLGIGYEEYYTGNRGRHFYIYRPHAPSHLLPQIDKEWVAENFPKADLSIYTHLHLFRLSGTRHEKTGEPKVLVNMFEGNPLFLPNFPKNPTRDKTYSTPSVSIFLDNYIMSMTVPHDEGSRHQALLSVGIYMKQKLGESIEFISRWLHHMNLTFTEPTPDSELESIIQYVQSL